MMDLRPVGYVIGLIVVALGATMVLPMVVDWHTGAPEALVFLQCAVFTVLTGGFMALTCANGTTGALTIRQAFLMTACIWALVPLFAALPFMLGATQAGFTDAYFEAVSGITTTGSTVFVGLDALPPGLLLWRGLLNWLGGLGIVIVALIFLPVMRVGGMQFFRAEGFDTLGKILPRVTQIARALLAVYVALTVMAVGTFLALGMTGLEAAVHGMAAVATGGFSTRDASLTGFSPALQWAAAGFMLLGSLPYIRFVQLANGLPLPLWRDPQARAYLSWIACGVAAVVAWRLATSDAGVAETIRLTVVNLISVMSGTGFFAGPFEGWGSFGVLVAFVLGFVGGCTSSSSGALSVFRVQVMLAAIRVQIARIHAPHSVRQVRYDGRTVGQDVLDQVTLYSMGYFATVIGLSLLMVLCGVDDASALFAIWTSIGNIGFGLGPMIARTGTMVDFPDAAKWLMILAMLMGRLGLLAILLLVSRRFWRE